MHTIIDFTRTLALFALIMVALVACGSASAPAPPAAVNGPALLFFYTDN